MQRRKIITRILIFIMAVAVVSAVLPGTAEAIVYMPPESVEDTTPEPVEDTTSEAVEDATPEPVEDTDQQELMTGWRTVKGKTYYYNKNGVKVAGLKKIEGYKYYFNKKGVMQTGLKTIKNKKYYFDKKGRMATGRDSKTAMYKKYLIGYNGVCHKLPKKTGNKKKDALGVAKTIAKCVPKKGKWKDINRVGFAAFYVYLYCLKSEYTMKGTDYREAYGVFITKKYSCAGATRAMGMVLDCLGYKWTHVDENKYTHQWCKLKMDGKTGYVDAMGGACGYGKYM